MTRQTLNPRTGKASERLRAILERNRHGQALGFYSICSANRFVIEAGMLQARRDDTILVIESTSNQVNQYGGYTERTPSDFAKHIRQMAHENGFPPDQIVLGGDHLGPFVWRSEPSREAMQKACALVRDCVRAGFTKIHLDGSMRCADDKGGPHEPLPDELVSARAAELCAAAEQAYRELRSDTPPPIYVIGTEVPAPGGGHGESKAPAITNTDDLARTLQLNRLAFRGHRLEEAWERVIAVVVQPGVEFGEAAVHAYEPANARTLSQYVVDHWSGVYEAHSTDYQTRDALKSMVRDHFAILKVGPWLTFAFREAIFALQEIEKEWLTSRPEVQLSCVSEALERAMVEDPVHWKGYYRGNDAELRLARKYSYSDRARYYWPQAHVAQAVERLIENLERHPAPVSLLSQYLPHQAEAVRHGVLVNRPADLIRDKILQIIDQYADACGCRDEDKPQTASWNAQ